MVSAADRVAAAKEAEATARTAYQNADADHGDATSALDPR